MKKKLYLVRHGQTIFNRKRLIQGWCDSPLTPHGHKQAKEVKKWLEKNDIHPTSFYCSTLGRTEETLKDITDQPYQKLEGIKEMFYGEMEGEEIAKAEPGMQGDVMGFYVQFGGENRKDVGKRMYDTISKVMKEDPSSTILMCTHGACAFQFARRVDDKKAKAMRKTENCTIYEFEYDDETNQFSLANVYDKHVKHLADPEAEKWANFYKNKDKILYDLGEDAKEKQREKAKEQREKNKAQRKES